MTTLLIHHPIFAEHLVPFGHPERPDRIRAVEAALAVSRFDDLVREQAEMADVDMILSCHTKAHLDALRHASPSEGMSRIDPDTVMSPKTFEAALIAVGGACQAVDRVMSGEVRNAFCAMRPPGHHAEPEQAMGFCFLNQAAIAARHAQSAHGAIRVAIVDWDVHHGNGSQAIFWDDPSVLYASTHQMPLYPGTGAASETGAGNIVNVPLPPGADGAAFRAVFDATILPALDRFEPDLIIISAGFDAHERDPLGGLALIDTDFAWATQRLMDCADRHCGGRIVSVLEGGYDLRGLAESTAAHVAALMGVSPPRDAIVLQEPVVWQTRNTPRGRQDMADKAPQPGPAAPDVSGLSFEKAMAELETIVGHLERGDVPLEESITIYERGEVLKKHCEKLLANAEAKVEKIRVGSSGQAIGTTPLDVDG